MTCSYYCFVVGLLFQLLGAAALPLTPLILFTAAVHCSFAPDIFVISSSYPLDLWWDFLLLLFLCKRNVSCLGDV